ncbi:transcriptional Coactivator p15-domain-containing protein [Xylariaceae sp. FL0016]|nr:transcriptional Coactivator p15-domain-containing protein [Xylariaceae sp. FL0016]
MAGTKRARRPLDEYEEDVSSDDGGAASSKKKSKKPKTDSNSGKDAEGNSFWALSNNRRVTISDFKGKTFVNIREYYTDASGDMKPGKKGITITPEQYNAFLEAIPAINAALSKKGFETSDISSVMAETKSSTTVKKEKAPKKSNIEATSDEEEDEKDEETSE